MPVPNRWGLVAGFLVARRAWRARPWQLPKGAVLALLLIELVLVMALVRSCVEG